MRRASLVSAELRRASRGRQRLARARDVFLARRKTRDRDLPAHLFERRLVAVEIGARGVELRLCGDATRGQRLLPLQLGGREGEHRLRALLLRFQHRDLLLALLRGFEARKPRPRLGDLRGGGVDVGLLQVGFDRKQRRAGRDLIALAHGERLDPPGLVRSDEHEVGLDPALQAAVVVAAGGERERE